MQAAVLEGRGHNAYGCLILVNILRKAAVTASAVCGVVTWAMIDEVILPLSLVKRGVWREQGIVFCMVVGPRGEENFHFPSLSLGDQEMMAECRVVAKW